MLLAKAAPAPLNYCLPSFLSLLISQEWSDFLARGDVVKAGGGGGGGMAPPQFGA